MTDPLEPTLADVLRAVGNVAQDVHDLRSSVVGRLDTIDGRLTLLDRRTLDIVAAGHLMIDELELIKRQVGSIIDTLETHVHDDSRHRPHSDLPPAA